MLTEITGNTYPARTIIKSMGFKWRPNTKSWISYTNFNNVEALARFDGIVINQSKDSGIVEDILDTRSYKQLHGRCEDAPCCGCCGQNAYGGY